MEAKVMTSFLPELVTAVSGCVQSVSDQCLAKGLIPESVYKSIFESGATCTSEDKARTLVLVVKKSTETDERCFELFLSILEQELPFSSRDRLLNDIRKEANEKANTCTAVVCSSRNVQQISRQELPRESLIQQTHLLERLEASIRQHERVCAEKDMLQEKLKVKTEEHDKLLGEFEALKIKMENLEAAEAKSKIAACESEITDLTVRFQQLETTISEQGMQVKRGRHSVALKTKEAFATVARESYTAAWEKAREEMSKKEGEMSKRESEYKEMIKGKDLRIRESEDKSIEFPPDMIRGYHVQHLYESILPHGLYDTYSNEYWKTLGVQLGFSSEEMDDIISSKPIDVLCTLLEKWSQWYPGDKRGSTTFATYHGLRTALMKAGFGDRARDLIPYDELQKKSNVHYS